MANPITNLTPRSDRTPSADRCDIAIVGAGPYGLATSAALRSSGVDVRLFGTPMTFWREHMPAGMWMRSPWAATHFAKPGTGLTLDDYERASGLRLVRPLPLEDFVRYGEWFQRQTTSTIDERTVQCITRSGTGFDLKLSDGAVVGAGRVVLATGIESYAARPAVFDDLAPTLAMHTTKVRNPDEFAGARVCVVGGGQSALESAALLHESGADVEVVMRAPHVNWLHRSQRLHDVKFLSKLLYAPSDIGPAGLSRLVGMPRVVARLSRPRRDRIDRRSMRPAGSAWLVPRLKDVPITTGVEVAGARQRGSSVVLELSSGTEREVDRVVLGTGFRVDVQQHATLPSELKSGLGSINGYPVLTPWFESSVAGLYFLGAPAAATFGPLLRFVAGADFAARRIARHLASAAAEDPQPAVSPGWTRQTQDEPEGDGVAATA
jgi:FAD-dependent urate hydroxylase